jgi:hypothetical protein
MPPTEFQINRRKKVRSKFSPFFILMKFRIIFQKFPSLTLRACQGLNISGRDFTLWLNIVDYLYWYSTELQSWYTTYKNLTVARLWTPFTHRRKPNLNRHINTKYLQDATLYLLTKFQVNRRKTVATTVIILKPCSSSTWLKKSKVFLKPNYKSYGLQILVTDITLPLFSLHKYSTVTYYL